MGSGTARAAASLQLDKIMFPDGLLKIIIFAKADNLVFSMKLQQKCSQHFTIPRFHALTLPSLILTLLNTQRLALQTERSPSKDPELMVRHAGLVIMFSLQPRNAETPSGL